MNKNFFLKTLLMLGLFGNYVVENDGAGGGDDDFDIDIDDDGVGESDDDGAGGGDDDGAGDEKIETVSKEEFDAVKEQLNQNENYIAQEKQRKALEETESSLKAKYEDFDMSKVKDYLVELNKTDPAKAKALNNSVGFENIYLTTFKPKEVENDHPIFGRNVEGVDRSAEVREKLSNGQNISSNDKQTLLSKFI